MICFFCNQPPTTSIYTLSLHDALPISKATKAGMAVIMVAGCAAAVGCHAHTQASGTDQGPVVEVTVTKVQRGFITDEDRKSTRLNSSHANISYAVFCLKKKKKISRTMI